MTDGKLDALMVRVSHVVRLFGIRLATVDKNSLISLKHRSFKGSA